MMEYIEYYKSISDALLVTKKLSPLNAVTPTNLSEEKEKFLRTFKEPQFEYATPQLNISAARKKLHSLDIDIVGPYGCHFQLLYQTVKEKKLAELSLLENLGNRDEVINATMSINGAPKDILVYHARKLAKSITPKQKGIPLSNEDMRNSMIEYTTNLGLDWKITLEDVPNTRVDRMKKKIILSSTRTYYDNEPKRLAVHEIGTHAVRAANGYTQPFSIFYSGFPEYLSTEEGLATFNEVLTGTSDESVMRLYALRVIAIDSVLTQSSFRNTFEELVDEYGVSEDQAFYTTYRVHRAGGYIKDHVYLEGYYKILEYFEQSGSLKPLYVGKIGIEDLPLIQDLLEDGVINPPAYLPDFVV